MDLSSILNDLRNSYPIINGSDLSSILNDPGNSYSIINGSDDDIISSSGNSEVQPQDSPATTLPACESDTNNKTDQYSINTKSSVLDHLDIRTYKPPIGHPIGYPIGHFICPNPIILIGY